MLGTPRPTTTFARTRIAGSRDQRPESQGGELDERPAVEVRGVHGHDVGFRRGVADGAGVERFVVLDLADFDVVAEPQVLSVGPLLLERQDPRLRAHRADEPRGIESRESLVPEERDRSLEPVRNREDERRQGEAAP